MRDIDAELLELKRKRQARMKELQPSFNDVRSPIEDIDAELEKIRRDTHVKKEILKNPNLDVTEAVVPPPPKRTGDLPNFITPSDFNRDVLPYNNTRPTPSPVRPKESPVQSKSPHIQTNPSPVQTKATPSNTQPNPNSARPANPSNQQRPTRPNDDIGRPAQPVQKPRSHIERIDDSAYKMPTEEKKVDITPTVNEGELRIGKVKFSGIAQLGVFIFTLLVSGITAWVNINHTLQSNTERIIALEHEVYELAKINKSTMSVIILDYEKRINSLEKDMSIMNNIKGVDKAQLIDDMTRIKSDVDFIKASHKASVDDITQVMRHLDRLESRVNKYTK